MQFHSGALLSDMETVLLLLIQRKTGIYISFSRKLQQISFLSPPVNRLQDNSTWIVGGKKRKVGEKNKRSCHLAATFVPFPPLTPALSALTRGIFHLPLGDLADGVHLDIGWPCHRSHGPDVWLLLWTLNKASKDVFQAFGGSGFCAVFPTALFNAVVFSMKFTARLTISD